MSYIQETTGTPGELNFRLGATFPEKSARLEPAFTPPQTQAITSVPHNMRNPENENETGVHTAEADFPTLSLSEMQNARGVMDVLAEMLTAIDPAKKEGLRQEVIVDLVEQCRTYKKRLVHLVNSTSLAMELPAVTLLNDLDCAKIDYTIKVRIVRLWSRPMFNNPRNIYCYDMIIVDEEGTRAQGFVLGKICEDYKHLLKETQCLIIRNPTLAENLKQKWKYGERGLKLSFNERTTVTSFNGYIGSEYGFSFTPFDSIEDNPDEDKDAPKVVADVIGYVVDVSPLHIQKGIGNAKDGKRITFRLEDLEKNQVYVTLFDEYADQVVEFQSNNKTEKNVVIILQFAKYKFFQGCLYFSNLYTVTRVFINTEIDELLSFKKSFLEKLGSEASLTYSGLSSPIIASPSDDYLTGFKFCTIGEITSIKERMFVILLGTIKAFGDQSSWYYNACKKCSRSVKAKTILKDKSDGTDGFDEIQVLECKDALCNKDVVYSVPRIRLSIRVQDCTGTVSLTLFEREVVKLLNVTATQLLDNNIELCNDGAMPEELSVLLNKKFAFKVLVSSYNFTNQYDSYSISKLTDDPSILSQLDKNFDIFQPMNDESQTLSESSLAAKGSVSSTGDNVTPMSRMIKPIETTPSQDGESHANMLLDKEFKRKLENDYDVNEECYQSSTKSRKAYKQNEENIPGKEGLLIPKIEK